MSRWLEGLNPEQLDAVKTITGPLLVLAGAGSGKTLVITRRIAFMLERSIPPEQILAVTFTNKAAAEMRERLQRMVGKKAAKVTLSTFHSLGLLILRAELSRSKKSHRFVVYDTGDQLACLREIQRRVRLGKSFDLGAILARISSYKNAFLPPGQINPGEDSYDQAAATFYGYYLEAMESLAAVDFDDLVCRPTQMMEESSACKKRWADRFRYVLVDEYQDTNHAQLRMLRAISGKHRNLCVVGDDDQSIYGWRGAEVRNILQFERDFPGCLTITLNRNYRSVGSVLSLANHVIGQSERRYPKKLMATRQSGSPVKLVVHPDGEGEAAWIADRIHRLVRDEKMQPEDIAVLYRSAILSRGLETTLRQARIPYRIVGGQSLFDRKEVKDILAYLRLCQNPSDSISLRRVINWPSRGIGPTTLGKLSAWSEKKELPLYRALEQAPKILGKEDRSARAVVDFWALIRRTSQQLKKSSDFSKSVGNLIDELGVIDEIQDSTNSDKAFARRSADVSSLLESIQTFCRQNKKPTLQEYLTQISLTDLETDSEESDGEHRITISTLHGAKGLEFRWVFFIGLEEGFLPHDRVLHPHENDFGTQDLSEELRLCYVGITRAKDQLVLSRAAQRLINGKPTPRAVSRFIAGLPEDLFELEDRTVVLSAEQTRARLAQIRAMLSQ